MNSLPMETEDLSSLRVASFSCYLNPEESFVQKIWPGSSNNLKISSKPKPVGHHHNGVGVNNNFTFNNVASSKPVQDPTVAFILPHQHIINNNPKNNYFINTTTTSNSNYATVRGGIKYANDVQGQNGHFKSATTTPSVCSESSSQMALLPNNIIKQRSTKKGKNNIGRKFLLGFGCRGPCSSDKKAVFLSQQENNHQETARKSLEVFGGDNNNKAIKNGGVAGNMERKLSMLTWDAIPNTNNTKPQNNNLPTPKPTILICDDDNNRASDASSDLFEIEDISSYLAAGDYTSSVCSSPTCTQYAPSEASIQWSVVTASVADYVSDYCGDDKCNSAKANKKTDAVKSGHKRRSGGGLLGCNSHKAVSVAETLPKPAQGNHPHAQLSFPTN